MPTNGNDSITWNPLNGSITTDTASGTLLTAGQDSILLSNVYDFEV